MEKKTLIKILGVQAFFAERSCAFFFYRDKRFAFSHTNSYSNEIDIKISEKRAHVCICLHSCQDMSDERKFSYDSLFKLAIVAAIFYRIFY